MNDLFYTKQGVDKLLAGITAGTGIKGEKGDPGERGPAGSDSALEGLVKGAGGAATNTPIIQAAIDSEGGTRVVIPAGFYEVSSLTLASNTVLVGAGRGATTLFTTGSDPLLRLQRQGGPLDKVHVSHLTLRADAGHIMEGAYIRRSSFEDLELIQRSADHAVFYGEDVDLLLSIRFANIVSYAYGNPRSVPAWHIRSSKTDAMTQTIWDHCVFWNSNFEAVGSDVDTTQPQMLIESTEGTKRMRNNVLNEITLENAQGGGIVLSSVTGTVLRGIASWDIPTKKALKPIIELRKSAGASAGCQDTLIERANRVGYEPADGVVDVKLDKDAVRTTLAYCFASGTGRAFMVDQSRAPVTLVGMPSNTVLSNIGNYARYDIDGVRVNGGRVRGVKDAKDADEATPLSQVQALIAAAQVPDGKEKPKVETLASYSDSPIRGSVLVVGDSWSTGSATWPAKIGGGLNLDLEVGNGRMLMDYDMITQPLSASFDSTDAWGFVINLDFPTGDPFAAMGVQSLNWMRDFEGMRMGESEGKLRYNPATTVTHWNPVQGATLPDAPATGVVISSPLADRMARAQAMVMALGINDSFGYEAGSLSIEEIKADWRKRVTQFVNRLGSRAKSIMVLTIPPANGERVDGRRWATVSAMNEVLRGLFGDRILDLRGYLLSEQVFTDTGLTRTEEDKAAQEAGTLPASIMARTDGGGIDQVHVNEVTQTAIARFIQAALTERGWIGQDMDLSNYLTKSEADSRYALKGEAGVVARNNGDGTYTLTIGDGEVKVPQDQAVLAALVEAEVRKQIAAQPGGRDDRFLILGPDDEVPPGTKPGTVIIRETA